MSPLPDPCTDLSPEERRHEVAALLAQGLLRLSQPRQLATETIVAESLSQAPVPLNKRLEISETRSVHVTSGSHNGDDEEDAWR
jgi:hypothetical protein